MDALNGFISIKVDSELIYSREKEIIDFNKNNLNSHKPLEVDKDYTSNASKEK